MPGRDTPRVRGLYVIVDPSACGARSPIDVAEMALEGGASIIQWRDKQRDKGAQLGDARAVAARCRAEGALFIVNDHADLAVACNADGVHLGQHDLPIEAVRPVIGRPGLIGVSTNTVDEAVRAQEAGADYVAVGSVFPTGTKTNTRPAGLERVRAIKAAVRIPVVAIGGIDSSNIEEVVAAGADAAAVISAVCAAAEPEKESRRLAAAFPAAEAPSRPRQVSVRRRQVLHGIISSFVDALAARDRRAFLALFTPDGTIQDQPAIAAGTGLEAIGAWWDRLMAAQPAYRIDVEHVHIPAEEAALVWSITHGHGGSERKARGVEIISFERNLIASIHSYWDRGQSGIAAERRARAAGQRFLDALNHRDREEYLGLWSRDGMRQDPAGEPRIGIASIGAAFDEMLAAYPDYHVVAESLCTSGDEVAVAWNVEERQGSRNRSVFGVDVLSLDGDGKIVGLHSYWEPDNLAPLA